MIGLVINKFYRLINIIMSCLLMMMKSLKTSPSINKIYLKIRNDKAKSNLKLS